LELEMVGATTGEVHWK